MTDREQALELAGQAVKSYGMTLGLHPRLQGQITETILEARAQECEHLIDNLRADPRVLQRRAVELRAQITKEPM